MKKLAMAAGLLLLAAGAHAAPVNYVLDSVTYGNSFAPPQLPVASCPGCGIGTATDDGLGNISFTGVAWTVSNFQADYAIAFDGSTTVGAGVDLDTTNRTCTQTLGTTCDTDQYIAGLNFDTLYTGIGSDGTTACANDRCRIDVSQTASSLTIAIKRALSSSPTSSFSGTYQLNFSVVPVPGAVWLLGSALGFLGLLRRRFA